MRNDDLLTFAIENGMLDLGQVAKEKEMFNRKKYLDNHRYWYNEGKAAWMTFLEDFDGTRRQVRRKSKEELEDIIVEYYKDREIKISVADVVKEWLDRRVELKMISPATGDRYAVDARRFLDGIGEMNIRELTANELVHHIEESIGRLNLTSKGFSNFKTLLKGCFRYAFREGYVTFRIDDVLLNVEISRNSFRRVFKEDEEEVFNEEETQAIIEYLVEHLDKDKNVILLLALLTGMRIGEAASLQYEDLDDNAIRVRRTNTRWKEDGIYHYDVKEYAKTEAGMRTVIIPEDFSWLTGVLTARERTSEYIFPGRNGTPHTDHRINQQLVKICGELGIPPRSTHKLRKTWFTIMLDNNMDNNLVTKVGGHSSIMTSERNYHRNRKSLSRMSKTISGIEEFQMSDRVRNLSGRYR